MSTKLVLPGGPRGLVQVPTSTPPKESLYSVAGANVIRHDDDVVSDDPDLLLLLKANKKYAIQLLASFNTADAGGGSKWNLYTTGDLSLSASLMRGAANLAPVQYHLIYNITGPNPILSADIDYASYGQIADLRGVITVGATDTTLSFQWAQKISNAENCTRFAKSFLSAREI